MLKYVNFQALFEAWGIQIIDADVEETKISPNKALKVALKCLIINSMIKSQHIIPNSKVLTVTRTVSFPIMETLREKTVEELQNFTLKQV